MDVYSKIWIMKTQIKTLVLVLLLSVLHVTGAYTKTIQIHNDLPLQEQMKEPNTIYVISGIMDLQGRTIVCPPGSILKIKRDCVVCNGVIEGYGTRIKADKRVRGFLDNVIFSGSFSNNKSYLSWWKVGNDVTKEINSLTSSFDGHIYLDKEGVLTNKVYIREKKNVIIDGCKNTFTIDNVPNNCFFAQHNQAIEFRDINIVFSGCNVTGEASILRCFRIEHQEQSIVLVHDVTIKGFSNLSATPCSFNGINVMYCNKGTTTKIYNVQISDIEVKGDGKEITGPGGNYGIIASCYEQEAGKVEVFNCRLYRMSNINTEGKAIYEDTSGIYLAGRGPESNCHWHATINNCYFEDISKRNIKIQGDYVSLRNLESNCTSVFLKDFKNMFVGMEGNHLIVKDLRGRYDGTIIKITGDYLTAKNIHCSSELRDSKYARVFTLDGCIHSEISNCSFSNDSYIFIYPTEKNFPENIQPVYSFSNCSLTVKHLIYCVSDQKQLFEKAIVEVYNSDINLASTVSYNGLALKEIRFIKTHVQYKDRLVNKRSGQKSANVVGINSSLQKTN